MRSFLRRLRGSLGTAATWATAWALGGFAAFGLLFWISPGLVGFWEAAAPLTLLSAASGFVAGIGFSGALGTLCPRREVGELSAARMGLLGAVVGSLVTFGVLGVSAAVGVPLQAHVIGLLLALYAGLGALTASGTIKLAQQGEDRIRGRTSDWPVLPE